MNTVRDPYRKAIALAAITAIGAPAVVTPALAAGGTATVDTVEDYAEWIIPSVGLTNLAIDVISKPKQVKRYTDPACEGAQPICGVVVYANAGGYTVSSVGVNAKSSQPSGVTLHPSCTGVDRRLKADVKLNTYDTFVLPANCQYKLQINISGGKKKSRDIFLTPGCLVQAYTDGTTLQNEWHKKIKWTEGAKPEGASDTPADLQGNKCSAS